METVYKLLKDDAQVVSLVAMNIFPGTIPQKNGYPAIVYSQLSQNWLKTKDGKVADGHRFTLEIYADLNDSAGGYPKAKSVSQAAEDLLGWYRGSIDGYTYFISIEDETDASVEEETEAFKIVQDYTLRVL